MPRNSRYTLAKYSQKATAEFRWRTFHLHLVYLLEKSIKSSLNQACLITDEKNNLGSDNIFYSPDWTRPIVDIIRHRWLGRYVNMRPLNINEWIAPIFKLKSKANHQHNRYYPIAKWLLNILWNTKLFDKYSEVGTYIVL